MPSPLAHLAAGAFHPSTPSRREALRREWNLAGATVYAYAGKLNRGKGLEMLLRVWRRFTQAHSKVRLLLIGSGAGHPLSCEETLRAFTKTRKLEDSVIFTGYVDDVPAYLNASDVFVFPSESESQGLAVLEAMACKLPVIASQIPGIMDMIEDGVTGKLVPPRDETAWLRALTDFDPNAEATLRQAETAAALVREQFDIAAVSRRHVAFFRKIHEEF